MILAKEMVGEKYGRLYITGVTYVKVGKKNRTYLFYKCDCGTEGKCRKDGVLSGAVVSCGCNKKEKAHISGIKHAKSCITHGMTGTRLFRIWQGMKSRCYQEKSGSFKYYGARGITVCEEWKNDFITFKNWALQTGYKETLSIDRIDVDGNYEPSNCRWATLEQQNNNKRTSRYIIYNGERRTLSQWARYYNLPVSTLFNRLKRGKGLK